MLEIRGHFDGETIVLDELFDLKQCFLRLIVN